MRRQQGQALAEFAVVVVGLVGVLLVLSLVGQLLHVRMKATQAAGYVLWEHVKGMAPADPELGREVTRHFFENNRREGWRTAKGTSLLGPASVRVESARQDEGEMALLRPVAGSLGLVGQGVMTVDVRVMLQNLEQYTGMPTSRVFRERVAGVVESWQARSPDEVTERLEHAHAVFPYPVAQKRMTATVNGALRLIFGEIKADTRLVRPDMVPADRLKRNEN